MKSYIRVIFGLVALMILFSCTSKPPIVVFFNLNGYSLTDAGDVFRFDTVVFKEGRFLEVGDSASIFNNYRNALFVDYRGKTMLPGLIDAHAHIFGLGEALMSVNLMGISSLEKSLDEVKAYAARYPTAAWVTGRGWNQTIWEENTFPTAIDLDRIIDNRPVYLGRVDGHAAWVNTLALEKAGITKETPDPPGGAIIRDENGNPTGILIDRAMNLVRELIPPANEDTYRMQLAVALNEIAANGLTGVHDAGVNEQQFKIYKDFKRSQKLTTRVYGLISGSGEIFDRLSANGPVADSNSDMLTLRSVKLYSDGALGSRGAALKEDYADDPGNRGLLFESEDYFYEQIKKVSDAGFQVGIHAIGDKANHVILNAFERAFASGVNADLRHRIEHAQIVTVDEIPRFAALNLIASMQPIHATSDMNMAEDRVGPDRILGGYAWRTFLTHGVVIASGSDFPVEPVNPFFGLHAAVNRTDHKGNPSGGWFPEQRMTRAEALRTFTLDAAYAAHMENRVGSIKPGKWADFIIIDRDFFEIDSSDIWEIQVLETWVSGLRVFHKN
jgi:predicted amidohydrolase YtcJ